VVSIRQMLRFAHSQLNNTKKHYAPYVCGDVETELHRFFHCSVHSNAPVSAGLRREKRPGHPTKNGPLPCSCV